MYFIEGVVEIWLTSEDLGAYGHDINVTLPQLLWKLVEVIPEGARMRLGMTNPPYILEHLEVRFYFLFSLSPEHAHRSCNCCFNVINLFLLVCMVSEKYFSSKKVLNNHSISSVLRMSAYKTLIV